MKHFAFLTAVLVVLGLARPTQADTIQLAWNANTEADLAGYVVSYGTAAKTYTSTFDSGNNTSQPVANLVKGTRYYFVVKAYNTSGVYSAASQEISGVASDAPPSPPAMPAGPTPASGASGVSVTPILSWAASTGATQYAVAFGTTNPPAVVSSSQTGDDLSTGRADRRHDVLLADRRDRGGRIDERPDLESDHRGPRQPGAGRVLCVQRGHGDDDRRCVGQRPHRHADQRDVDARRANSAARCRSTGVRPG